MHCERCIVSNSEPEACRTANRLQGYCEARGRTLVLLQDAANLQVDSRRIEPFLCGSDASSQAAERGFDPSAEFVVHGLFFAASIGRAAQDHGFAGVRMARELDLDAFLDCAPAAAPLSR
jgi:hypothetical protein